MDEFDKAAITWLRENSQSEVAAINRDTDLVANGILDSLRLTEFIIFIEEVTGKQIEFDNFRIDNFRTLEKVYRNHVA